MALRVQVLHGYRSLLRASRMAFGHDLRTLVAFKQQLRQKMDEDSSLNGAQAIKQKLHEMADVEGFMRNNLVQGQMNQRGNFEVKLEDRHRENMEQDEHLQPVDTSVIGQQVTIERSTKKDMKHNPDETIIV